MRQSLPVFLQRTWNIQSPMLYRYLEKEFCDAFFKDGSLRLSSFNKFSTHKDEQRKDTEEGYGLMIVKAPDGSRLEISAGSSLNSYVFCASTLYSDDIAKRFRTDSGFRINNIQAFADAISKKLPFFSGGVEGGCIYLPNKVLELETDQKFIDEFHAQINDGETLNRVVKTIENSTDLYFLKDKKYSEQCEYRLIWHSSNETENIIDIKCPEAIQFCTRFDDLTVEKNGFRENIKKSGWHVHFSPGGSQIARFKLIR